jgi:Flp pilus assembly pilin Flp
MTRRFASEQSAATAAEYAVMTLIAIGIVAAVSQVGDSVSAMYARVQAAFSNRPR